MSNRPNRRKALRLIAAIQRSACSRPPLIELTLTGSIGKEIRAARIRSALLRNAGADVRLAIDSEGGSVSEAMDIFGALRDHPCRVTAHVGRHCASAAVIILLGADKRAASPGAAFLVHGAAMDPRKGAADRWTAGEYASRSRLLESTDDELARIIAERTKQPAAWVRASLRKETTMNAREALQRGFVHELTDRSSPRAAGGVRSIALGIAPVHLALGTIFTPPRVRGELKRLREQLVTGEGR